MNFFRWGIVAWILCAVAILAGGCNFKTAGQTRDSLDGGNVQPVSQPLSASSEKQDANRTKVRLVFDGGEAFAELYDNPTSRDFASMLPVRLAFKEYNGTEKIADPPRKLTIENAPNGFAPSAGELALFAPWGNLAVFYREFRYSEGLVPIGRFISGLEAFSHMEGVFTVRIETVEE